MHEEYLKKLTREAKFHARGLRIPEGAAEDFINLALKNIPKKILQGEDTSEIRKSFIKNLDKYQKDLAYVLKNYENVL